MRWHCVPLPAAGAPAIITCSGGPAVFVEACPSGATCGARHRRRVVKDLPAHSKPSGAEEQPEAHGDRCDAAVPPRRAALASPAPPYGPACRGRADSAVRLRKLQSWDLHTADMLQPRRHTHHAGDVPREKQGAVLERAGACARTVGTGGAQSTAPFDLGLCTVGLHDYDSAMNPFGKRTVGVSPRASQHMMFACLQK